MLTVRDLISRLDICLHTGEASLDLLVRIEFWLALRGRELAS